MEKTKLPKFKGKPLIEVPKSIPQIGFLEGNFGKAFLEEYNGRVKSDYNDNSALNVLEYDDNVVKGSNPFAVVLANSILRQEGLRTAKQVDLEKALKIGWNLRGTYEDTGLVLKSKEDDYVKNTSLAKNLAEQLKKRGIKFSSENPIMIPLTEFELEKADNNYGLAFKLRENAEIYEAPVLSREGKFGSKDIDEKAGLPKKVYDFGDRTLYVRGSGLSGLGLYRNLGLNSDGGYLDPSSGFGRVVVVSGEATHANFERYTQNLKKLRDEKIAEIDKRYKKAKAILRGK